jgi:hypothetical protein
MDRATERDVFTLHLLEDAEEALESALRAMPNESGSVFTAAHARDLYRALGTLTAIRTVAARHLARRPS